MIVFLLVVFVAVYVLFIAVKYTPPISRKISLGVLIAGLCAIEIYLRMNGAKPGFTIAGDSRFQSVSIIPVEDLVEDRVMICDSNGINKFNLVNSFTSIQPLNSDGFRSPYEFSQTVIDSKQTHGKKVTFFIGDSWVYGLNADSGCSFADILSRSNEYMVLNAGIPGADLPQYKALVKAYILSGKLKPDKVVVCISRNDLHHIPERKLSPGILWQYCTNAGAFHSYFPEQDTLLPNAKSAYAYVIEQYTISGILGEGWYTDIISKSVAVSRFVGWVAHTFSSDKQNQCKEGIDPKDPTEEIVQDIKNDCERANVPVLFILLPSKFALEEKTPPQFKNVVSLNAHLLNLDNYAAGNDDHPDNDGHRKLHVAIKKIMDDDEQRK